MSIAHMSTKGQVVIPAEIRRKLKLGRDARLRVELRGREIVLTPVEPADWRSLEGVLAGAGPLTCWLEEERARERERGG